MPQVVLMGDPTYFHIAGGANPLTRDWWGRKKRVDCAKAIEQWTGLKELLVSFGVEVHVIPPDPKNPGLVYPANAGVLLMDRFILSNLIPTRAGERAVYDLFLRELGIRTVSIGHRFEGEADLFPCGRSASDLTDGSAGGGGLGAWARGSVCGSDRDPVPVALQQAGDLGPGHRMACRKRWRGQ